MLFVKDTLIKFPNNSFSFSEKTEMFYIAVNLRKQKQLIFLSYNPHKHVKDLLLQIKNRIDFYSKCYENTILTDEFNAEIPDGHMNSFCGTYNLKRLIKEPIYYKNNSNATCIDLLLRNCPR